MLVMTNCKINSWVCNFNTYIESSVAYVQEDMQKLREENLPTYDFIIQSVKNHLEMHDYVQVRFV